MNARSQKKPATPKILNWATTGVFILFALFMTLGQNQDFLRKLQELDLFLNNYSFFLDSMHQVGGLSTYLSSFLNQFFYYPVLGSILLIVLLLLVSWLTFKTFKLNNWTFSLSFIPSLLLLLSMTELGYMIYYQKVDGFVYNNILGVILALSGLWVYNSIHKQTFKVLFALLYLIIAYPLFGAFTLFGVLLMILVSVKHYFEIKKWKSLTPFIVLFPSFLLVPIVYYEYIFKQIAFSNIYTVILPNFKLNGTEFLLWLPYLFLAVFFSCLVLWKPKDQQAKPPIVLNIIPALIFISCMVVVYLFSFKDENFNMELSMQTAAENEQWDQILDLARKQKEEPTRLIVLNTNLALYKLGLAGDKMYHFKNGNKKMKSPRFILPVQIAGTMFYYQYGLTNYCNKWCMEGMVEYGLYPDVLKYFVRSSLLNGEIALAKKYNDVLLTTLFYKNWALQQQTFIDHPESIPNAPEYKKILALNAYDDVLDGDYGNMEAFLKNHFSHLREVPRELTELSVLFTLETKNIERFWPRFFRWVRFNMTSKVPVHFQEAALLYENLEHKVDLTGAPFDETVKANFRNYMSMVRQYGNYPEEALKQISYNQFGNTFWHYYFFVKDPLSKDKDDKEYKN
jgi:hypothetical protein